MSGVDEALHAGRRAVDEFIAAGEAAADVWTVPPKPGKWTPSQVAEHVAFMLEEAAKVASDQPSAFPRMPFFVRPVFRTVVFNRVVRTGKAPKAKTFKAFDPESGPDTPSAARERLLAAMDVFETRCKERSDGGQTTVDFPVFGMVSLQDFVTFQALHVRHHKAQIPIS